MTAPRNGEMPNSLSNRKLFIGRVLSALVLVSAANYYLDLGIFGRFAKQVFATSVLILAVAVLYLVPPRSGNSTNGESGESRKDDD